MNLDVNFLIFYLLSYHDGFVYKVRHTTINVIFFLQVLVHYRNDKSRSLNKFALKYLKQKSLYFRYFLTVKFNTEKGIFCIHFSRCCYCCCWGQHFSRRLLKHALCTTSYKLGHVEVLLAMNVCFSNTTYHPLRAVSTCRLQGRPFK